MTGAILKYGFLILVLSALVSCNDNGNDEVPPTQQIVTNDTSQFTGELMVNVLFRDPQGNVSNAPSNTRVSLAATFEDLSNELYLYDLLTNNNSAYFGFINHQNYYVQASRNINGIDYSGIAVVQVRPRRMELLTVTMFP